jgi:hypothetical protein
MQSCCSDFALFPENGNIHKNVKQEHSWNSSSFSDWSPTKLTSSSLHAKLHQSFDTMTGQVSLGKDAVQSLNASSLVGYSRITNNVFNCY